MNKLREPKKNNYTAFEYKLEVLEYINVGKKVIALYNEEKHNGFENSENCEIIDCFNNRQTEFIEKYLDRFL